MSRGGTSGKGGRNYRLNWAPTADGGAKFGDWTIVSQPGWRLPWEIRYQDRPFLRRHGDYTGSARFKTVENAQRKIEKYVRSRRAACRAEMSAADAAFDKARDEEGGRYE